MVQLTRIYTKGGDKGTTSLGSGKRVPKHDARVSAYGTVDEANAAIGVARLHLTESADENLSAMLARIQNDLFDLGADLCRPESEKESSGTVLRILESQVERLEREIDSMNAQLAPLNSFVLPGGEAAAAHLHMARTIVRRAEREMTLLAERETVSAAAIRYVNRLSDHLFVAARFANELGAKDVLWEPGATRAL
jgi:cob(I)alamin adenosyltransferase